MKLNKLILICILALNYLFASQTPSEIINSFEDTLNQKESYISSYPNRNSCYYECPTLKEGYFGRIANIDIKRGETSCYVYDKKMPDNILARVSNVNQSCKSEYNNIKIQPLESKPNESMSLQNFEDLKKIEEKYKNYSNVGTNQEFVNLSKYMIAGLTVDEEIIDVPSTIKYNQVTLNSGYTLYPNSIVVNENKSLLDELKSIVNSARTSFQESLGIDIKESQPNTNTIENKDLVSTVKGFLTNSIIFIINFLNEYNDVMLIGKTFILFTIIPITIGMSVLSKLTKYVSNVSDFDDIAERIILGVATMFIFFFSTSNIKVDDKENKISQTNFHQLIRPVLYKGAYLADLASSSATNAYLKYKLRDVGLAPVSTINEISLEKEKINYEQTKLTSLLNTCSDIYNTEALKQYIGVTVGLNQTYPPSENLKRYSSQIGGDTYTNFYNTSFLKNESFIKMNGLYSVSSCYKFERKFLENKTELKSLNYLIKSYQNAKENDVIKKQVEIIANMQYRNNSELGFTSLPMLATTSFFIDNIGLKGSFEEEQREQTIKDYRKSSGYEIGAIAEGEGWIDSSINWSFSNIPYVLVPGFDSIQRFTETLLSPLKLFPSKLINLVNDVSNNVQSKNANIINKGNNSNSVHSKMTNQKPVTQNSLYTMASNFKSLVLGIVADMAEGILDALIKILSIFLAILIIKYLISYLPIIAISTASFMVIFFYYFMIEIYYLAVPFMIAFAFSTNQLEHLKTFMKVGLTLAFKPLLIVISIVMALFAKEFFETINVMLINLQFEPMYALNEASSFSIGSFFDTLGLTTIKGFLLIGNSIIGVFVVFYLVFNGANMILDIFGIRDSISENQLVGNVESKTAKWQNPI
ncbi:hypothetical protein [Halarcobacter ebronensis]|uniref:TraG N-terminal Proteobacteria domain-containing protein n=1 Tax=Halarcobacter ebronensis TaxID=1462615 RepID=A0A4Q1ANV6_9BACT|nr:hypothetical protein [Halarcobacter ebronensis]QKF82410.1 putative membrane protein [Halarcobacter ebronensis]RXK07567.1 hypothetical protein CRV07_03650 [Halarcobacter ebronensis]